MVSSQKKPKQRAEVEHTILVPGSSQKMLDKSRSLTVDCVAYDLEDSVTMDQKSEARANIHRSLAQLASPNIKEHAVRINAIGTGLEADDLREIVIALFPSPIYPI